MSWTRVLRGRRRASAIATKLCFCAAILTLGATRILRKLGAIGPAGIAAMLRYADFLAESGMQIWRLRRVPPVKTTSAISFNTFTIAMLRGTVTAIIITMTFNVFSHGYGQPAFASPWFGGGCNCRTVLHFPQALSKTQSGNVLGYVQYRAVLSRRDISA